MYVLSGHVQVVYFLNIGFPKKIYFKRTDYLLRSSRYVLNAVKEELKVFFFINAVTQKLKQEGFHGERSIQSFDSFGAKFVQAVCTHRLLRRFD